MPVPDLAEGVALNVADFKEMIQQVVFCRLHRRGPPGPAGRPDDHRCLRSHPGSHRRLPHLGAKPPRWPTRSRPIKVIIPARALNELARIAADGEDAVTMVIPAGRGQVIFHLKNAELVSQLIDGNFPDYKVIIPRAFKTHTILSTTAFLKACKQAEIIARDGNNVIRMTITAAFGDRPGEVEISAKSEETGNAEVRDRRHHRRPRAGRSRSTCASCAKCSR